jgi:hypothetical protein
LINGTKSAPKLTAAIMKEYFSQGLLLTFGMKFKEQLSSETQAAEETTLGREESGSPPGSTFFFVVSFGAERDLHFGVFAVRKHQENIKTQLSIRS